MRDIPVAKTFVYKGMCFLYDTYTNRLLKVTKEHFEELNCLLTIGINAFVHLGKQSKAFEDILKLINKGMLRFDFVQKVEHKDTEYLQCIIDRGVTGITLQVTKDCNFHCRYCTFANSNNKVGRIHEKTNMSWNVARQSIDFLYEHSKDAGSLQVAFYGGEPMLNFKLIVDVVNYTERRFFTKNINFMMTTNGSFMNDAMLDFLIKHDFKTTISFDGPEMIQNNHRKFRETGGGTFSVVYNNIKKIRNKNNEYFMRNISFIPVAFKDEDYQDVLDFFNEMNINQDKIHKKEAGLDGIDYIHGRKEFERIKPDNSNESSEERVLMKLMKIYTDKEKVPLRWHHNGPCIPLANRMFVSTNGLFYICEKSQEHEDLSLGNFVKGVYMHKVEEYLNFGRLTEEKCKNCWAMRFCGMCVLQCIDTEKNKLCAEKKTMHCDRTESGVLSFFKEYVIQKNLLHSERIDSYV